MADDDKPQAPIRVEDKLVGPAEICDWLGISMKAFSHLAETRVAVPITRGKYLLKATVRACYERAIKSAAGRDSATGKARSELLTIQAERAKFQHEVELGLWFKRADVIQEVCAQYRFVRSSVLAATSRIGDRLPHLSRTDLVEIDDELRACLTTIGTTKYEEVLNYGRNDETALETGGSHGAPYPARSASGRPRRRSRS